MSGNPFHCEFCMKFSLVPEIKDCCNQSVYTCAPQFSCPQVFMTKEERSAHLLTHLDDEFIRICFICGKRFKTTTGHKNHFIIYHGNREKDRRKWFKCNKCGRSFPSKSKLHVHYISHSDMREYPCKICGKSYKYKHLHKKHMQLHGFIE